MFKIDLKLSIDRLIFEYGYVFTFIILLISCNKDVEVYGIELNQDSNLSTLNTNSTNDTFGIGTLIATPSNLPFNEGIISPIVFEAPVDVGIIDWLADLALLGSL